MRKIYSAESLTILYLLKSKLESQNIGCFIKNEEPPVAGEIPPIIAWPELWVLDDNQYIAALNIVQGELSELTKIKSPWQCPNCKEHLEGQFDVCWKCGQSKPE